MTCDGQFGGRKSLEGEEGIIKRCGLSEPKCGGPKSDASSALE